MGHRKIIIYISLGFIVTSLVFVLYFFIRKTEKIAPPVVEEGKKVIVFKDVKYSGEKKGVVDWTMEAKIARKYLDKPIIELEDLTGQYKPKDDVVINFKGTKGFMDTDKESGSVENVDVLYKGEYRLQSAYMNFDFKSGITMTKAPIDITGTKLTMKGTGLTANTREETVRVERDVSGLITTQKAKYRFETITLTHSFKKNLYVLDGKVAFKGDDINLVCDRLLIFTTGEDLEKVEAFGKVRVTSRGTIAKSEKAVYHFKEGKIVFTNSPSVIKENAEMKGESIIYNTVDGKISVNKPKIRLEK